MKSVVIRGVRDLTIEEREIPKPAEGEALLKMLYCGICGSDIHLFNGTYNGPHSYPMRFGHEWSGVVEAVGSEVTRVEVGDVVTGDCSRYCGACPSCEVDKNLCQHIEKFGITVDGASADYILRDEMYFRAGCGRGALSGKSAQSGPQRFRG